MDVETMTYNEIRAELKRRGAKASGKKCVLQNRLRGLRMHDDERNAQSSPAKSAKDASLYSTAGGKEGGSTVESATLMLEVTEEFNSADESPVPVDNFIRGFRFSPDGTCILTNSNDNVLRLFEIEGNSCDVAEKNEHIANKNKDADTSSSIVRSPRSVLNVREGETIYDFCWYPFMHYTNRTSCCFVATSRDAPVHLWDAYTGHLRATYRAYDHNDNLDSAVSVAFDLTGQKLFCGYDRMIRVFDVTRPGRSYEERPTRKTRKSRFGQRGIISCLAFSSDYPDLYAAGSYARSTAIYSERGGGEVVCELHEQLGGVTHVQFSGHCIFIGGRKDPYINCWDLRFLRGTLCRYARRVTTNQRVGFDIDTSGRYLLTGSSDANQTDGCCGGSVLLYNIASDAAGDREPEPVSRRSDGFRDIVNDVHFHPTRSLWGATTGQRHFDRVCVDESSDEESEEDQPNIKRRKFRSSHHSDARRHIPNRNTLSVWAF